MRDLSLFIWKILFLYMGDLLLEIILSTRLMTAKIDIFEF